jgi:NAD(P)-dependent dehydrogenase (short-subunit alcohol dehydrogenase family)
VRDGGAAQSVVVTGASSGIGLQTVRLLVEAGFHVFAGVRDDDAEISVGSISGDLVTPLRLDVTRDDSIDACRAKVEDTIGTTGLRALINNAGIGVGGPLEYLEPGELRRQFDVNVFGVVSLTQAFLPSLRQGRGRIVNVGSLAGRMAFPLVGPYSASKFALEALSDCLRVELRRAGIKVTLVEPGFVLTPMHDKGLATDRAVFDALPEAGRSYYRSASKKRFETHEQLLKHGIRPERVAQVIRSAVLAARPRARYVVGTDARLFLAMKALLPQRLQDRLLAALTGL